MAGADDDRNAADKEAYLKAVAAGKKPLQVNLNEEASEAMEDMLLPSERSSDEEAAQAAAKLIAKLVIAASSNGSNTTHPDSGSSSSNTVSRDLATLYTQQAGRTTNLFEVLMDNKHEIKNLLEAMTANGVLSGDTMAAVEHALAEATLINPRQAAPDNMEVDNAPQVQLPMFQVATMEDRSFLRTFHINFTESLHCPREFSEMYINAMYPAVVITGASNQPFLVRVEYMDNRAVFTDGWEQFVASERLVRGDVGRFSLQEDNKMLLALYAPNGNLKPPSARPAIWTRALAEGSVQQLHQRYHLVRQRVVHQIPCAVPHRILEGNYILGPNLAMGGHLMTALYNAWTNFRSTYPLYAVRLNPSHVNCRSFYFSTRYAAVLPQERVTASLFYADHGRSQPAVMLRRMPDNLPRITTGWARFIRDYGMVLGDVFIFIIEDINSHLVIRLLRAMLV